MDHQRHALGYCAGKSGRLMNSRVEAVSVLRCTKVSRFGLLRVRDVLLQMKW